MSLSASLSGNSQFVKYPHTSRSSFFAVYIAHERALRLSLSRSLWRGGRGLTPLYFRSRRVYTHRSNPSGGLSRIFHGRQGITRAARASRVSRLCRIIQPGCAARCLSLSGRCTYTHTHTHDEVSSIVEKGGRYKRERGKGVECLARYSPLSETRALLLSPYRRVGSCVRQRWASIYVYR